MTEAIRSYPGQDRRRARLPRARLISFVDKSVEQPFYFTKAPQTLVESAPTVAYPPETSSSGTSAKSSRICRSSITCTQVT